VVDVPRKVSVLRLGLVEYGKALTLQRVLAQARIGGEVGDLLLLLEHPPVVTLGRGARREHLLMDPERLQGRGIAVFEVERGGDVTYHGPGQLVGYPILDLSLYSRDLHRYMRNLEEVLILALKDFGIGAERRQGLTGVFVQDRKIASLGVHVKRWVSWHGFALNVTTDLSFFDLIVPCGLQGVEMTSLEACLGRRVPLEEVIERVILHFQGVFEVEACEESSEAFYRLLGGRGGEAPGAS